MPPAPMKIPVRQYSHLIEIWNRCGSSPFLTSYLHDGSDGRSWASYLRALKIIGMVQANGRVHANLPTRIWQITPGACEKLVKKVGPVSPEIEEACQKYTREKSEDMIRLMRSRANLSTKEREEKISRLINEGLVLIREIRPNGGEFVYADLAPKLPVKNTRLLGQMEKHGLVEKVGKVKSPRSTGVKWVTVWRLAGEES